MPMPVIQNIDIYSQQGSVLRIQIEESNSYFIMSGDYVTSGNTERSIVGFSGDRVANCEERFEKTLISLRNSLNNIGDQIVRIHNPCNTPFITGQQQAEILNRLNILAEVEIN